jgi:cellulose synthase/poly-beta-1,6-N-acetylglucosamine synthase-like glycosyltransferase
VELSPIVVFNALILVFFMLAFFYQFAYIFVVWRYRHAPYREAAALHTYGFVVCAHNEGAVITELVQSIKAQDYPAELIDVFVFCDNCSDDTAELARAAGAIVYERPGGGQKGKSWVMDFGLRRVLADYPGRHDAFIVFDADNLIARDYVREMNNVFDEGGYAAITSYRNSKNFDSSWISRGYGTWFMREATYLNNARMILGTSCAISGSGFLIAGDVVRRMGGWDFHLLTEDIQFSTFCAVNGYRIGYAHKAMFYDEQPVTFSASWKQRMRWTKGFYQVFAKYGSSLVRGWRTGRDTVGPNGRLRHRARNFAAYDMLMTIAPAMILTLVSATVNGLYLLIGLLFPSVISNTEVFMCLGSFCMTFVSFYVTFFLLAVLTTASERKNIRATRLHLFTNLFTFPVFMLSYVPIALAAAVKKVDWVPTRHTISTSIDDLTATQEDRS